MAEHLRYPVLCSFLLLIGALLVSAAAHGGTDVLTNNYDNYRTGANLDESALNAASVGPETFARLFSYRVDGPVFSQPLIATRVDIPDQGVREVVYITTAGNSVYAFDANGPQSALLWRRTFEHLPDGRSAKVTGILSTPVIDRLSHTLYVVTGHMDGEQGVYVVHALDLRDGSEKNAGPVTVAGAVRIDDTVVPFAPTSTRIAVQRAALALAQGRLIVAFGGDFFEGWVFSFDQTHLQSMPRAYCTTCVSRVSAISKVDYLERQCTLVGPGGGIWQSGRGPVVDDAGRIYFFTGNKQHIVKDGCLILPRENACSACKDPQGCTCKGNRSSQSCRGHDTCEANQSVDQRIFDTHDALIALDSTLALKGWFRPSNWNAADVNGLEYNDLDLGGSGPILLPGTRRLIGGGKQGVMYTLDVTPPSSDCQPSLDSTCIPGQAIQSFQVAPIPMWPNEYMRQILGGPVLWSRATEARVYLWRENDTLRSYVVSDKFEGCNTDGPPATTTHNCPTIAVSEGFIDHHPGGILALSAHGGEAASGIVWAAKNHSNSGPAQLMAFRALPEAATASKLAKIWDSAQCEGDALETGSEFMPPTVANGKVYLATGAGTVEVFGLVPKRDCIAQPPRTNLGPMMQ